MTIPAVLMIVAFILFVIAAFGVPSGRFGLVAAGLASFTLARILQAGIL